MTIQIRNEEHPSRHLLSRHLAGELEGEERDTVKTHVSSCNECNDLLAKLKAELNTFRESHNKENFLAQVKLRADEHNSLAWWQHAWRPAALFAAAAIIAGLVLFTVPGTPEESDTRLKGSGIELGYFVMEAGKPRVADPSRILHPGDRIQFRLTAPAGGYLHLLGIDEAGTLSVYFPRSGQTPAMYPGGALRPVPGSVILDDTLGRERVFVLICNEAMSPSEITEKVRRMAAAPRQLLDEQRLPIECRQSSLLMVKESR